MSTSIDIHIYPGISEFFQVTAFFVSIYILTLSLDFDQIYEHSLRYSMQISHCHPRRSPYSTKSTYLLTVIYFVGCFLYINNNSNAL